MSALTLQTPRMDVVNREGERYNVLWVFFRETLSAEDVIQLHAMLLKIISRGKPVLVHCQDASEGPLDLPSLKMLHEAARVYQDASDTFLGVLVHVNKADVVVRTGEALFRSICHPRHPFEIVETPDEVHSFYQFLESPASLHVKPLE